MPTEIPTFEDIVIKHRLIQFSNGDKEELEELLSIYYDEKCTIKVEIPGNENRKAYSEDEIGFKPVPMPKKSTKKGKEEESQTGDYSFQFSNETGIEKRLKIRFERKSVEDFCGTVINNWGRFLAELERARFNPEIEDFRIVVEGDRLQALTFFFPYPKICKYCESIGYRMENKKRKYYCRITGKDVNYNSNCRQLRVKKRSPKQIAQLISFKRKKIGLIEAMGFPIEWCGSRGEAATHINVAVKQYFIVHYEEILGLNAGFKLVGEDKDTLTFKADGTIFRVLKTAVDVLA